MAATGRRQPRGICSYCGLDFSRGGMLRHLEACRERRKSNLKEISGGNATASLHHIRVQDVWDGNFWLDLEIMGSATMRDLDRYLRVIWLECCNHLSMFTENGWRTPEVLHTNKVSNALKIGTHLLYIYDYGDETNLSIKCIDIREGEPLPELVPISVMTRNDPLDYCIVNGEIINSPRLGLCGYDGPANPPSGSYPAYIYNMEKARDEMDKEWDDHHYETRDGVDIRFTVPLSDLFS